MVAIGGWAPTVADAGFALDIVPGLNLSGAPLIAERTLRKSHSGRSAR